MGGIVHFVLRSSDGLWAILRFIVNKRIEALGHLARAAVYIGWSISSRRSWY